MLSGMNVIISLYNGEKAAIAEEKGVYTFLVNPLASKPEIVQSLESIYSLTVTKINTIRTKKTVKVRRKGTMVADRKYMKKALVSFGGAKIDIFASSKS
jgi:large subunit ribosomal protein L23